MILEVIGMLLSFVALVLTGCVLLGLLVYAVVDLFHAPGSAEQEALDSIDDSMDRLVDSAEAIAATDPMVMDAVQRAARDARLSARVG